jgi:pimeloyl-ACP methyl ester carboxylesterase
MAKSKDKETSKETSKETIILIHGLNIGRSKYRIKYYGKLEKELLKNYNVLFFSWNREKTTNQLADDLREFIAKNKVKETHFICHSFGAVVFRVFYQKPNCRIGKVIFIAPLVNDAKVLEYCFKNYLVISRKILGHASEDLLKKKKEIFRLPIPKGILDVVGTKNFTPEKPEAYILMLLPDLNLKNSDGKVFLKETSTPYTKERFVVKEYHDLLPGNEKVIRKIKMFLKG